MTLCVTGPMAAGKNLAASILQKKGFAVIDADDIAHEAVDRCSGEILSQFSAEASAKGIQLETPEKKIDRRALASIVFADPALLKRQEDIVYPYITEKITAFLEQNSGKDAALHATVLYKIPSLLEMMDAVLFIDAPMPLRFIRARKRDSLSARRILDRFRSQRNLFAKYRSLSSDIVRVWNIGSGKGLEKKIDRFLCEGQPEIKKWNKKEHCGF